MNVHALLYGVFVRYGLAQAALLPLMLLSWFVLPRHASLRLQWLLHRAIVVLVVALPIAFAFPVIPDIPILRGERLAAIAVPPRVEPAPDTGEQATPLSPPPSTPDALPLEPAEPLASPSDSRPSRTMFTSADVLGLLPAVLAALSGLGILAFAVAIGRQVARERAQIRSARAVRRIGKVRVVTVVTLRSPFSTGLLAPRIYLPLAIARRPLARRMVLAHEAIHVRDGHIAWVFLERLLAAAFWFNPLAHLVATSGARLRELVCDRNAGRIRGDTAYCRVLLNTAAALATAATDPVLANGWIGRRFFGRRLEFLASGQGKTTRAWIAAVAPIAVLAGLAVIVGCGPRVLPTAERETTTSDADAARLKELGGSVVTLSRVEGAWPGGTPFTIGGPYPAYRDAVVDTAANGWNLGTGRMYNLWTGPEMKTVLGVNNPDGFWFVTDDGAGVDAVAFNDDIHAVIAGILLHLPFLQRVWAALRASDPGLEGETGFVLSVNPDGVVTRAEPDPAQPGDTKLAKAYAASMQTWKLTTRRLVSGYRMRVPFSSYFRQGGWQGDRVMAVRLGDAVAEVPGGYISGADYEQHGGFIFWKGVGFRFDRANPGEFGITLVAIVVAPDGSIRDAVVLDSEVRGSSRAIDFVREVKGLPRLLPVPSGREITLVLMFAQAQCITEANARVCTFAVRSYAVGTDAVRYLVYASGGHSGPVKLELPDSAFLTPVPLPFDRAP